MASGGVTAAVGAIALLAGIAVGWWTGATKSDQVAVDLTKQVDTARTAKESAESEKETLRQSIARLEASLREAQTKLRDAEKDGASLREQLAAKPSPAVPATPAETASAKGPRFTFDEFSKLADVDWKSVGEHLSALAPLCDEIATALAKGEDLPPETTGKASQHNGFLITAALKIAGQVPGSNPNASYTNPAFMLNAIAATLESAGKPLTAEQATSLEKRARELTEEDVRRRQGYDASTYALQKVIEETELRRRFFEFAFKTLTPDQGAALTPPSARGLLGLDFFSENLVWVASVRPVTFRDVPSLVDSVSSIVQNALHVPKERWDDLHAVVDRWAHDLPPELTDPNSEDRARSGHVSSSNLRLASSATLTLLQKAIADLKLDGDSVAAARKWQGILLLMPSPE